MSTSTKVRLANSLHFGYRLIMVVAEVCALAAYANFVRCGSRRSKGLIGYFIQACVGIIYDVVLLFYVAKNQFVHEKATRLAYLACPEFFVALLFVLGICVNLANSYQYFDKRDLDGDDRALFPPTPMLRDRSEGYMCGKVWESWGWWLLMTVACMHMAMCLGGMVECCVRGRRSCRIWRRRRIDGEGERRRRSSV